MLSPLEQRYVDWLKVQGIEVTHKATVQGEPYGFCNPRPHESFLYIYLFFSETTIAKLDLLEKKEGELSSLAKKLRLTPSEYKASLVYELKCFVKHHPDFVTLCPLLGSKDVSS